ncbi:MAG: HlyD family efflux transporter periplasmic adaptor subunit [Oscillospiraceae bacterium]|nr:HlyD family efflux transporter periplasmic adaptor subunit [Oscillospiraceae bacterium]
MKKKKKFSVGKLIILIIVLAVAGFIAYTVVSASKYAKYKQGETVKVELQDLRNTVSFSGVVESKKFETVTTPETSKILTVSVTEGDVVKKGDVLATLDTKSIENEILSKQTSLDSSDLSADYTVSDAEKKYLAALVQINDGSYPEIRSARLNLESAQDALEKAEKKYNDDLSRKGTDLDTGLTQAKQNVRTAEQNITNAEHTMNNAKLNLEGAENTLTSAQNTVDSTKQELDFAQADLDKAKTEKANEDYSDLRKQKDAIDKAKKSFDDRLTDTNKRNVTKARDKYETALQKYQFFASAQKTDRNALIAQDPLFWAQYDQKEITDQMVEDARKEMETAKNELQDITKGYDDNSENLEYSYDDAVLTYAESKADIDLKHDNAIQTAARAYDRAKSNYEKALIGLEGAKVSYKNSEEQYNAAKDSYDAAKKNYEYAKLGIDTAKDSGDSTTDSLATAVADARIAVSQAQEAYNIAVRNANVSLNNLKSEADKQKVLSDTDSPVLIDLKILKDRLEDCVIKAPCDGTVTKVNAVVGSVPSGVLFIIEDPDDLKLRSIVKEYAIAELQKGAPVEINIPSLSLDLEGSISEIAPAGVKGTDGKSDGSASFDLCADIYNTKDTGVLIGMTAKGTAITDSCEKALSVTYDCVVTDDSGSHICIAERQEVNGQKMPIGTVKYIPVETGFEADALIQIISPEVSEGMEILTNAADYEDGEEILIISDETGSTEAGA